MLELNPTARHTAQAIELSLLRGELRLTSSGCATIVEEEEGDNEAEQIDLCKLALVGTLKVHSYCVAVDFFAISRDGRRVVSGLHSTLKVWDVETGECVATLPCHSPYVTSVAISPDGRRVVSGAIYPDNTLKVWDVATGECVATLEGNSSRVNYWHLNGVGCIDVFSDGQHIVSGSRELKVWNIETGKCVATLKGHSDDVLCVAVSLDGRRVVSGSDDSTLKVWNIETGKCVATVEGPSDSVNCVAISPDGWRVINMSDDGTLKLFAC